MTCDVRRRRCDLCSEMLRIASGQLKSSSGKVDFEAVATQESCADQDPCVRDEGRLGEHLDPVEWKEHKISLLLDRDAARQTRVNITEPRWIERLSEDLGEFQIAVEARIDDGSPEPASDRNCDLWVALIGDESQDHERPPLFQ